MQASANDYDKAAQLLKDKGYAIIEVTKDISDAAELFLKRSKEFFEKESAEKQKCTSSSGLDIGYQGVGDVREGFQVTNREYVLMFLIRLSDSILDIWNNSKEFKLASEECFQKLNSIAENILKVMVESLNMDWEQVTIALGRKEHFTLVLKKQINILSVMVQLAVPFSIVGTTSIRMKKLQNLAELIQMQDF